MFFGQDESSVVAFDEEHQLITLCCKFFFVHMVARLFFSAHSFRLHYEGGLSGGASSLGAALLRRPNILEKIMLIDTITTS